MAVEQLRETILSARPPKAERMTVPEWGGVEIEAWPLGVRQRMEFVRIHNEKRAAGDQTWVTTDGMVLLVIEGARDPDSGARLFSEADREKLLDGQFEPLDRIAAAVMKLTGMVGDAVDEAGKDSAPIPSGASSSASPSLSDAQ